MGYSLLLNTTHFCVVFHSTIDLRGMPRKICVLNKDGRWLQIRETTENIDILYNFKIISNRRIEEEYTCKTLDHEKTFMCFLWFEVQTSRSVVLRTNHWAAAPTTWLSSVPQPKNAFGRTNISNNCKGRDFEIRWK